jgi:iron complex outermembrane recepter protein
MRKFQFGSHEKRGIPSLSHRPHALLLLCSSALTLWTDAALAQEQQPQPDGAEIEAQEIIVSARRKDETLTTVPASITAYSSDFLQKQNIQDFADYATKIPNLTFQYGQGGSLLWSGSRETTIRGVVGTSTTAYYINDTPVPASVSPQVLNLDRIEVLKGPQGTLFGASSMGGNLRFITKKPSLDENEGTIQVQGGGTKHGGFDFDGNARTNIVLVPDQLAVEFAAGYGRDSGFITRRFPDATSGQLVSRDGQGRNETYSGSATIRAKFSDSLEATINVLGQISNLHGFPAAYAPLPAYKPVSLTVDRDRDVQEYSKDRWGLASLVLNYSGDGFGIVSSTSYFSRKIKELEDDTEGTNQFLEEFFDIDLGDPAFATFSVQKEHRFTQESRISFDDGTILPGLSGIAGIFYQRTDRDTRVPGQFSQEMADAGITPPYLGDSVMITRETNLAAFGELYYEIVPKLTVTVGLRQYRIKQKTNPTTDTGFIVGPDGAFQPGLRSRQSGLVPKAVVSYKIGNQGNIYASVSKGFRPGGSQQRLADICADDLADLGLTIGDVREFKSDSLWSYEIGAKSRMAGGRLNVSAAGFQIDWSNIQQSVLLPTCTQSFTTNAGKARIRGGELEVTGRPFAGVPLTIQIGLGYTDAILRDPGVTLQVPNSRLGQVPRWTGTISGYYETPLSDGIDLFVGADYSYTSTVKVPDGVDGFYDRQPFNIVNGNVGVRFGRSQIMIYGKNLLDKRLNFGDQPAAGFERQDDSLQRIPRAVVSRPRQLGVQYRLEF